MKRNNNKPKGFCTVFFSALANRLRIMILQELSIGPMAVNELAKKLNTERTLVSHNLATLSKAELIYSTKTGRIRIYSINEIIVPHVFFILEEIVCKDCSIRKTCAALRNRNLNILEENSKAACAACK